jgi:DNA polymerase elongation subunit (family B)
MSEVIFHLLDIQARDLVIEEEEEDKDKEEEEDKEDKEDKEEKYQNKGKNKDKRQFVIHLFGVTDIGQTIRCDVMGFRPTMYLRLPEEKTNACAQQVMSYIKQQGFPMKQLNTKRITKKIFYGFTANTFYPFLQLDVPSLALFRILKNYFLNDRSQFIMKERLEGAMKGKIIEVFEANLDPMLRFLHVQQVDPCGWVKLPYAYEEVIDCYYDEITATRGPRVSAPFLTASWDIECFSMTGDFPVANRTWQKVAREIGNAASGNEAIEWILSSLVDLSLEEKEEEKEKEKEKKITPIYGKYKKSREVTEKKLRSLTNSIDSILRSKTDVSDALESLLGQSGFALAGDPVIQIGTTLVRGSDTERHLFVFPDCAPIHGIEIHTFPTEKEMIVHWFKWLIQMNPDVLVGYNIFGFDEAYLWNRFAELGIHTSSLQDMTRLAELGGEFKLEEKFLSSAAMGDNRMWIWSIHGRLQIDLFHYIKRNVTLPSYKLDEVAKHFLSGKIKKKTYEQGCLSLTVSGSLQEVHVGRSLVLLDETGESVSSKLIVSSVTHQKKEAIFTFMCEWEEEMEDAVKWVIVKDDVSPQDIFRLHQSNAEGRAIVGKYCLQDCDLVLELYKKLETFNNSMSMANVCSVPVSYIFTRGQGIKIESLIFKACRERNVLIPVLPLPTESDDSYEGAIVLDPEPGFYCAPIGVCDFASLYPSTIVSENISHDSLLWVKDYTDSGKFIAHQWGSDTFEGCEGYGFTDIEFDILRPDPTDSRKHPRKIKCGRRICRYAQPLDGTKSTLPQITTWLLNARSAKKKEMKAEKDPERYALLDSEQLAYKLTGNSLYGQLGSGTFKIRLQALAASVTSYGRKQILFAKAAIEQFYGPGMDPRCDARCMAKVIYGDSVTGDTPVLIRINGVETNIAIQNLCYTENGLWVEHRTKWFYELKNCESWTDKGWTKIHRIIRHEVLKQIYRVVTNDGYIDVTEDHSLLNHLGEPITPSHIKRGSRLLSTKYTEGDECHNIYPLDGYHKWVYDLTTENHHFQAGPEGLIVHNTDSLFVAFHPKVDGKPLTGREARVATIELTEEAGHFITKMLKAPHDFEFDKAFDPLLIFSKKRYAGNMYEENADDYVHKYMGIALKRRDNAPMVKTIFGGAMKMLLDKRDVVGAYHFIQEKCMELIEGKMSLNQLMVTKSLRADYADPARIAHKVLADRITRRDPGNAPAAGDRIGYVYVLPTPGQEASKLQGDRIETPVFIKERKLVPDYKHYIEHQLLNPISQAFGILLERIPGFHRSWLDKCPEDMDGSIVFREAKAAEVLFQTSLRKLESMTQIVNKMKIFGLEPSVRPRVTAKITSLDKEKDKDKDKDKEIKKKQTTMSSFLYDSMLVDKIKKQEIKVKTAKAKAKVKEKEKEKEKEKVK